MGNVIDRYKAFSFLIFLSASALSILLLSPLFWLFIVIVLIDGISTLTHNETLLSADRFVYAIVFIIASVILLNVSALFLVAEILILYVVLDFSFLLIRVSNTQAESRVFTHRAKSYVYTLPISLITSSAMIYFYSVFSFGTGIGLPVLGVASAGVFAIIFLTIKVLKNT